MQQLCLWVCVMDIKQAYKCITRTYWGVCVSATKTNYANYNPCTQRDPPEQEIVIKLMDIVSKLCTLLFQQGFLCNRHHVVKNMFQQRAVFTQSSKQDSGLKLYKCPTLCLWKIALTDFCSNNKNIKNFKSCIRQTGMYESSESSDVLIRCINWGQHIGASPNYYQLR